MPRVKCPWCGTKLKLDSDYIIPVHTDSSDTDSFSTYEDVCDGSGQEYETDEEKDEDISVLKDSDYKYEDTE